MSMTVACMKKKKGKITYQLTVTSKITNALLKNRIYGSKFLGLYMVD